jgi:hypothetical protein
MKSQSRRTFLGRSLALTGGLLLGSKSRAAEQAKRPKLPVAGVVTVYRRNSHAHVILGKILEGFKQQGGPGPDLELVSLYVDQVPDGDMSRELAKKHGFRLAKTIDEAINFGGDNVAVAGVLSIGEHGNYPYDSVTKQHKYPRKQFFDEIVAALQRGGKVVPVFSDKHLSYRTDEALAMYQVAKELKIPFMAGSSLPVAWRVPTLNPPIGCDMEGAVGIGYGGLEAYGFHALEMLQCVVERRRGGESGVAAVRAAQGSTVLEAEQQGYWSEDLLVAALKAQSSKLPKNLREAVADKARSFYLIDYRDGSKACVAMLNGIAREFSMACKLKDQKAPAAAKFALQEGPPYAHFEWLVKAIEHMIHTGKPAYPVERTVLTTGIIDAAMHSLAQEGERIETPQLEIAYRAANWAHAPDRPPAPRAEW